MKTRNSGIEFLKIIGILMIILSHLSVNRIYFSSNLTDIEYYFYNLFSFLGHVGNFFFIIPSIYFLFDKNTINKEKIKHIITDTFLISIIFIFVAIIDDKTERLDSIEFLRQFLPVYTSTYWFISTYIVILIISPLLNKMINSFSKRVHLIVSLSLFFLTTIITTKYNVIGYNKTLDWICIYIIYSYIKKYGINFEENIKINLAILFVGWFELITLVLFLVKTSPFDYNVPAGDNFYQLNTVHNFLIGVSSFNLLKKIKINSKFINTISSQTLLVYLLHDNMIFYRLYRNELHSTLFSLIHNELLSTLTFTFILFFASTIIGIIYKRYISKYIYKISDKVFDTVKHIFLHIANFVEKLIN